jgi:ABC-type antimicrobial peptide transport system permease subunit
MSIGTNFIDGPIVGVLDDFHSTGFKDDYSPVFLTAYRGGFSVVGIKLNPPSMRSTIEAIESFWSSTFPDQVFDFQFLDQTIAQFYLEENGQSQLYKIIAGIAILLGSLGLYGLISFMTVQRVKEVGIRKTLGASTAGIAYIFLKEFIIIMLVAFVIASPIGWYFMNGWLSNYAYRVDVSWWIFLLAALISLLIVMVTTGYTVLRAARVSPVKALRVE